MMEALAFGAYNNLMPKPLRTEFDWLSRDESEVDKYIAEGDGFPMSLKYWGAQSYTWGSPPSNHFYHKSLNDPSYECR